MIRVLQVLLAGVCFTIASLGCASAPRLELRASPALVCPGDTVSVRLVSLDGHTGGRLTASPIPVAGLGVATRYGTSETAFVNEQPAQICETTTFTTTFWNGTETSCGADYTACLSSTSSVAFGDLPIPRTVHTCLETAEIEFAGNEFGSFQIREVINCTDDARGGRPVQLKGGDDTEADIGGGESSDAFARMDLVGSYTVRRTVIPPEACAPEFAVIPVEPPPPPPPICLIFVVGCADSDDCAG